MQAQWNIAILLSGWLHFLILQFGLRQGDHRRVRVECVTSSGLDSDAAAMCLYETLGDVQAQSSAAKLPSRTHVTLPFTSQLHICISNLTQ